MEAMGMSRGQIRKKHGDAAVPATSAAEDSPLRGRASSGRSTHSGNARHTMPARIEPSAATTGRSSTGVITGVLVCLGVLMFLYLYLLVLPGFGNTAGIQVPELDFGVHDAEHFRHLAETMGEDGRNQYRYIHRSLGMLTPVVLALGWMSMIAVNVRGKAQRWGLWSVPLVLAVVFLVGNAMLDEAVAKPSAEAAQAASWAVILRWALLFALAAEALFLLVRTVQKKMDAFARGELPEQQRL